MVYKVTKEPVGPIFHLIREWRMTTPSYLGINIHGIIFSNEGAKGREPLFDATEFRKKKFLLIGRIGLKEYYVFLLLNPGMKF